MSVMYIRNEQTGEFEPVPSLVGPPGPPGSNGDGAGTVISVNKVAPDSTGNVTLTAAEVGAADKAQTEQALNSLNDEKADKAYMVALFEELKALILGGDVDGAVALLDQAILDNSVLA